MFIFYCAVVNNSVPGFVEFAYKEIVPVCFIVPVQAFDMDDAQAFLVIFIMYDYDYILCIVNLLQLY